MTDLSALIFFDKKTGEYVFICPQMTQIFLSRMVFSHGIHGTHGNYLLQAINCHSALILDGRM